MSGGELITRTVTVRGFEGDERDLLRVVRGFGRVSQLRIQHLRGKPQPKPALETQAMAFAGLNSEIEATFVRGARRIPDPSASCDAEGSRAHVGDGCGTAAEEGKGEEGDAREEEEEIVAAFVAERASDPYCAQKALRCCESVLLGQLSAAELDQIADQSHVITAPARAELFVQGDELKFLYILVTGTMRVFQRCQSDTRGCEEEFFEDVVGEISGAGQMMGEVDYLQQLLADEALKHAVSISADVASVLVAVPVSSLVASLQHRWGGRWINEILKPLEEQRKTRVASLNTAKEQERSELAQILGAGEIEYLINVCGCKTYEPGIEDIQNTPEFTNSVVAIVLEGKIQLVDETDVAITPPITPLKPGTLPQPSEPFQTKIQCHSKFVMRTGSFRMAKTPSAPQDVILEEGHVLQERLAEARKKKPAWMNTSYKLKPCTGDGSRVKLLLVDYVDMRPIFSGSFAVRKYAEDKHISEPRDFCKSGEVSFSSRYPLLKPDLNDELLEQPLERLPWHRNQERRLRDLAVAKRRGRDQWRADLAKDELAEPAVDGPYVDTFFDPLQEKYVQVGAVRGARGANAPFYWNKTAIPTASANFRIHDNSMSDMEVSIVFESVPEAHAAVSELQEAWRLRFATIELAGQSEGYQSTLAKLVDELRGCGSNYQDAERIQAEYESLGVFADASVWRELVCIYNKSDPVQIDRAASTMWQLLNGTPFDGDLEFLLCESAHLWCSLGYVEVVEDIVSRMLEFGIEVPRAVVIAVLTGWIRLRDVERATQVMQTMQDRQCPPDLGTVNMLLALLITLGFEEEACSLLDSMENATEQAYHTKHLTPSEEAYLKKQMYVLVISGIVRHGNGKRAEEMVCRMIKRTGMQADALCINLVVEAWCIAGDMKTAKRVAVRLQEELKCDANEQTFALIAAGWAKAGKPAVACNTLLSLTSSEYDAEKIKLNPIITDWTKNRWRQPRGYCMTLPSVLVQKHAMAHTSTSHSMQSLDTNTSSPHSASNFGAMQKSLTSESSMWGPPSSELNLMTAEERVGVKNKAFHDLRCNDEEAFRNSIDRRSAAALEDEKFPDLKVDVRELAPVRQSLAPLKANPP